MAKQKLKVEQIDEDTFCVTDENGDSITVTKTQLQLMPDAVKAVNEQRLLLG